MEKREVEERRCASTRFQSYLEKNYIQNLPQEVVAESSGGAF